MEEKKSSQGIFSQPLDFQKKEEVKPIELKWKIVFVFIVATFIAYTLFFVYPELQSTLHFSENMKKIEIEINEINGSIQSEETYLNEIKLSQKEEGLHPKKNLKTILPNKPLKAEIIELFETFSNRLNTNENAFELNKIEINDPIKVGEYYALPIQTNAYLSQKNFDRLMALLELSGDYSDEQVEWVRLMSLQNLKINFRGIDEKGGDKGVDAEMMIYAYYLP